jgi:hypothetical protein
MKIDYERTGGFAGMRTTATFDLDAMPPDDAARIRELLDTAHFDQLPERIESQSAVADQFTHKITVTSGGAVHTVTTGDSSTPPALRELVDLLGRLARERRAN